MGLDKQGAKPTGLIGEIIGRLMNKFHTSLYIDYFKDNLPKENSSILDIGCGGGEFLKFLYDSNDSYLLYGLDHSPEMIELSSKINKRVIEKKRLKLMQGSVTNIKLDNSQLDLITAFETVQFWPDTDKSFLEINRLLKIGGQFLIINRYPSEGTKWWAIANIKSDKEYISKLENAGFSKITVDLEFKNGWIIVNADK
jgi:ubiquinone/menaquinone biosynthesis C-methylase UbiE